MILTACLPSEYEDFLTLYFPEYSDLTSLEHFARRMQSWLYFGFLNACFDEPVNRNDLVKRNESGRLYIDSSILPSLLGGNLKPNDLWLSRRDEELTHRRQIAASALGVAVQTMNDLVIPFLNERDAENDIDEDLWTSTAHAVIFSIDVLIDLVSHYLGQWDGFVPEYGAGARNLQRRNLASENSTVRKSVTTGRCPSLAWQLQLSSSSWYYISLLPSAEESSQHPTCTLRKCVRHNVDMKTYKAQHMDTCRGCDFLGVDQGKLRDCIAEDAIPLITCSEDSSGHVKIEVNKGELTSGYVAISHVWSGGLGNPDDNALPTCQINRLMSCVDDLALFPTSDSDSDSDFDIVKKVVTRRKTVRQKAHVLSRRTRGSYRKRTVTFWLDTLCVPTATLFLEYRELAINSMARMYAGASKVLVLDPELQKIYARYLGANTTSLLAYIRCSPWMARSSTLQEGALDMHLYMQFIDSSINMSMLQRLINPNMVAEDLLATGYRLPTLQLSSFTVHGGNEYSLPSRFTKVWNSLSPRDTTKLGDVHGILAVLMNLSAGEILSMPEASRMEAIIRTLRYLPLSILYETKWAQDKVSQGSRGWTIPFPGIASATDFLSDSFGILEIVDDGLLLKPSHLEGGPTSVLLVSQRTPSSGRFWLEVPSTKRILRLRITAVDRSSKRPDMTSGDRIFILSRQVADGGHGFRGAQLVISQMDEGKALTRLINLLTWTVDSESHFPTYTIAEHHKLEDPNHQVLIDVDMPSWPILKWSRGEVYPFTTIRDQYLIVWLMTNVVVYGLVWASGTGHLIGPILRTEDPLPFEKSLWFFPAFGAIRIISLLFEIYFWNRMLSDFAQALLQKIHPPMLFEAKTHLPFAILGIILLIIWVQQPQRWLLWCGDALLLEVALRTALKLVNLRYYKSIEASLVRFGESTNPNLSVYLAGITVPSSLLTT
ncbi:hypothetical protein MMC30_002656 [Trapelia coarctata]|nr:hypothetical protein [Trapelia coarctata]